MTTTPSAAQEFWDGFYADNGRGENGPVNRYLVSEVEHLAPGTALDLGCGEGWDALWLAEHGWQVVGVDVSATALGRARARSTERGLADRVGFAHHDLAATFPQGTFDLVSAQFLHSPVAAPGEREDILRRAAAAVAPGGRLLVVSHQGPPSWLAELPAGFTLPTPDENLAALHLVDDEWEVVRAETALTPLTGPDGQQGTREDHVLHLRRHVTGR